MSDQRGFVVWLLLGIGLLLGLGLWVVMQPSSEWGSEYFDYGEPTPLAADAPLREAFCAIRADFDTLPDRLIAEHKRHSSWTERRFAAGRFDYGPVKELVLTDGARDFVRRHSRAEIIAALAPLMALPEALPIPARGPAYCAVSICCRRAARFERSDGVDLGKQLASEPLAARRLRTVAS